jgi:hypothetical protein
VTTVRDAVTSAQRRDAATVTVTRGTGCRAADHGQAGPSAGRPGIIMIGARCRPGLGFKIEPKFFYGQKFSELKCLIVVPLMHFFDVPSGC